MADFLSIDWQEGRLNCIEAAVSTRRVRVRHCVCLDWPESIDQENEAEEAGAWLREQLAQHGVTARSVLISIPRQAVVVRNLSLPNVPDGQLANLVWLQAETISASSLDNLILDFLPLPREADATSRQVLLVTLTRAKLERIRECVKLVGLELEKVGLSSVATAELVAWHTTKSEAEDVAATLIVAQSAGRLEISLMRDHRLLFMHSAELVADEHPTGGHVAWAEVRRALGAISRTETTLSVSEAWLIERQEDPVLRRLVKRHLGCDVHHLDLTSHRSFSFACPAESLQQGFFTGCLGMLLAAGQPRIESVDFLDPRRAVEPVNQRRRIAAVLAAGVLLVASVAYFVTAGRAASLSAEIEEKEKDVIRLDEAIRAGQPLVYAAQAISKWERGRVEWLQQMIALNDLLPGTAHIYLNDFNFLTLSGDPLAHVRASGLAKSRRDVEALYQTLARHRHQVRPQEIANTSEDLGYPIRFQLDAMIPAGESGRP